MTILLTASALALAACGDEEETSEEAEAAVTPEAAIDEIAAVRAGLDDAAKTYAGGDADAAAEIVNETYLQHFELVEGPLEEADEELNEELEEQIREELVAEIESAAPKADVDELVAEIESGLEEAEAALSGAEGQ
jgi:hypothetical protein